MMSLISPGYQIAKFIKIDYSIIAKNDNQFADIAIMGDSVLLPQHRPCPTDDTINENWQTLSAVAMATYYDLTFN